VASLWLEHLDAWAVAVDADPVCRAPKMAVQTHRGAATAALVLTPTIAGHQLLALIQQGSRWRVSAQPASLLQVALLQREVTIPLAATEGIRGALRHVQRVVKRWHAQQQARQLVGLGTLAPTQGAPAPGAVQRRALAWLKRVLARLSLVERQQFAPAISAARLCIQNAVGVAAEQALAEWMRSLAIDPFMQLHAWRKYDVLARGTPTDSPVVKDAVGAPGHGGEVTCCLLYVGVNADTVPCGTPA
jgi:hypothetical protein